MAFLDLTNPGLAADVTGHALVETRFTRREWTVIALAHFDRPMSLKAPGRFRRMIEALFNIRRPNRFADIRLESLRHLAVRLRIGGDARIERERFFAAGFSTGHYETLVRHIAPYRTTAA